MLTAHSPSAVNRRAKLSALLKEYQFHNLFIKAYLIYHIDTGN